MVCGNCTYRVHEPCIVAQPEDLFPCILDPELAIGFDECGAVVDNVCLQDRGTLAEESGAQMSTACEVGCRKCLKRSYFSYL
jgi:hypothetical protein